MDYGVHIESGARDWQLFQQDETGFSDICLRGVFRCIRQSFELPLQFEEVAAGDVVVKARVALEETGEDVLPWTECQRRGENGWETRLRVPAGGLYRVETYMEYEGWNGLSATRGDMVHNIGVGDIFVIAGQSNAAGRAKGPVADPPQLGVHVLRPSGQWQLATHPLGETTAARHLGNFENHNPGHSPWLHFAKRLKAKLGYPIGLVPCAYGGAPLRWWNPEENGALFQNMRELLRDAGVEKLRGMLWYQGEAEGYEESAGSYAARFAAFVRAVRSEWGEKLPFITVQLNRCVNEATEALDRQWGLVREAQRQAMYQLENLATLPAGDIALYDFIHNSAEGNLVLGERCAKAALDLCYGLKSDWRAPEPSVVEQTAPDTLRVTFSRIHNWLNPYDLPAAALPFEAEDQEGLVRPAAYETGRDSLSIRFERPLCGAVRLHGAWRMNSGGLIPCDCMRMPMLSFYGVLASAAGEGDA